MLTFQIYFGFLCLFLLFLFFCVLLVKYLRKKYNSKYFIPGFLFFVSSTYVFNVLYIQNHYIRPISLDSGEDNVNYYITDPIDVVYTWVNGSDPQFLKELKKYSNISINIDDRDMSTQRFDDKYELKYSLRSLEKFAPWIRHVYIVTNGQIPYWLNLDYEKVSVITHKEIFPDNNNLPTFSSPAIECNIHRIPNLSDNFLYFNDDIFLFDYVYIEDFLTQANGFKIYLSWPLPDCYDECPWSYVKDGSCDLQCNNEQCQFDGGDCDDSKIESDYENMFPDKEQINNLNYKYFTNFNYSINWMHGSNTTDIAENNNLEDIETNKNVSNTDQETILKDETDNRVKKFQFVEYYDEIGAKFQKVIRDNKNITKVVHEFNRNVMLRNKERKKFFLDKQKQEKMAFNYPTKSENVQNNHMRRYISNPIVLKDTYAMSLNYVNMLFNLRYSFKARKVVSHMPLFINKNIMEKLQNKFNSEFLNTSKQKFRSNNDMQYAFSYMYFLMSEQENLTTGDIFDFFDTDESGTWSDREIRTLLTRINDLPLTFEMVSEFEYILINCSKNISQISLPTPPYERYLYSKLPTISKLLVQNCKPLEALLKEHFGITNKYKFEIMKDVQDKYVTFKMLTSNLSQVIGNLDEIRKTPKKFICLNDNMIPGKSEENNYVKTILNDFYMSLFPKPSRFELPHDVRNRFSYINEFKDWQFARYIYKFIIKICFFSIAVYMVYSLWKYHKRKGRSVYHTIFP